MTQNPYDIISTYKTRISKDIIHVKTQVADNINPPFNPYWVSHTEYAHRDHLGSIEVVTDDSGNVLNDLAFEPFGSRKSAGWEKNITPAQLNALLDHKITSTGKVRGFTGHRHSDRTGFIHMNGRVYDPLLGRFLSPDPIVQSPDFSQSWNRYSYVFNNPLRFVDPTGFVGANDDGNNCIDDPSCTIVYISAENFARLNSETEQTSMTQQLDTFGLWANIVSDGVSGGGYGQRVAFGTDNDVITAQRLNWWASSYPAQEEPDAQKEQGGCSVPMACAGADLAKGALENPAPGTIATVAGLLLATENSVLTASGQRVPKLLFNMVWILNPITGPLQELNILM